ncbi:YifB family Mg chelatase-like AAA ATPase [Microbispora hainanensis]|uniref:ATP-binding protein n=1 Tax=Microbispora hainanensis TaxID=568844 RepID=A0A544YKX2_9ACTN|nr:YifB family Mg chelatase-like AAA ATPase [Microbispora hainanensis]TQS17428.1 ATP-binding protein [Microbispora hainanensis]
MPVARTNCVGLVGVTGRLVEVEADVGPGIAGTHFIGLLDTAISEARGRVRSALINSRLAWPDARVTVSLFPATLPKRGSIFDLAIAIAVLGAAGAVPAQRIAAPVFVGELGLDGRVRPIRGVLPAALAAAEAGVRTIVVPALNAAEAALVPDLTVVPVATLGELVGWLRSGDLHRLPVVDDAASLAQDAEHAGGVEQDEHGGHGGHGARTEEGTHAEHSQCSGHGAHSEQGAHAEHRGHARPAEHVSRPAGRYGGDRGAPGPDLCDVAGQPMGRKALEVCAAGGHNLWMLGPPGSGKTMLAERLPTLLPPLDQEKALEVSAIHSVAGTLPPGRPLLTRPPFMAPHHSATMAAVVGGGSGGVVRPGAVSLAHRGVLFLDEAPEFATTVLDSLRQPLESGTVTIARAVGAVTFPARFMLVMAANPCPCGLQGTVGHPCKCTPAGRRRYLDRLSGPLLDRVDVKVKIGRATRAELLADRHFVETSATVAERVRLARERAAKRLAGTPWRTNAEVSSSALHRDFRLSGAAMAPLHRGLDVGTLSARGLDRVLRISWTLADLSCKDRPDQAETSAALALWLGVD